jgi:hypothetical protein
MQGQTKLAVCDESLNLGKGIAQLSRLSRPSAHSAASLAPRFLLPPCFASTGARNLPV